mgnify:CR=1 FL=1|jgi:hypothetical protein
MDSKLVAAYRFHRARNACLFAKGQPTRARDALRLAREDVAAGVTRHAYADRRSRFAVGRDLVKYPVWFESESDAFNAGFRLVGFSDALRPAGIRHKGWHADEYGENVYRGAVFQVASKRGVILLIAAYHESESCGFVVSRDAVFAEETNCREDAQYYRDSDACLDAASFADDMARRAAERQREYEEAWWLGSRYADLGEHIATTKTRILALIREMRLARKAPLGDLPIICKSLNNEIRRGLRSILSAREERAAILRDNWFRGETAAAFNEGADAKLV